MMFFKKHASLFCVLLVLLVSLTAVYFSPLSPPDIQREEGSASKASDTAPLEALPTTKEALKDADASISDKALSEKESSAQDETPKTAPPSEKDDTADITPCCTLCIRCDTLLSCLDHLPPESRLLVPSDGIIFPEQTVPIEEGDSVFDVLKRTLKVHNIHLEFSTSPLYKSVYVEGIANLYEFDAGELSGWMYKVNGVFPQIGSSGVSVSAGDCIEWVYTCDLGYDVGGGGLVGNGV